MLQWLPRLIALSMNKIFQYYKVIFISYFAWQTCRHSIECPDYRYYYITYFIINIYNYKWYTLFVYWTYWVVYQYFLAHECVTDSSKVYSILVDISTIIRHKMNHLLVQRQSTSEVIQRLDVYWLQSAICNSTICHLGRLHTSDGMCIIFGSSTIALITLMKLLAYHDTAAGYAAHTNSTHVTYSAKSIDSTPNKMLVPYSWK